MSIDRRKQIVDAAHKSFALFGYKATTMDQVAKMANVGKGTIYTFFSTKEELFDEIMRNLILQMKQVGEKAYDEGKPFFQNLHRVLYELLDFRRTHELTIKLLHEVKEMGTPQAKEALKQIESAILTYIKKKVQDAIDKGEIKPCDPEITAFVMLKLYIAFVHDWEQSHESLSKQQIAELFQIYLVEGLAVK